MKNTSSPNKWFNRHNILKNSIKFILITVVVYFVYKQLVNNWSEVITYSWSIDYPILLLSIIMHLITFVFFSKVWCILIAAFGFKVSLWHAFKIGYITNLGRYIPGKVWPVIGMSYLAKKLDISEEVSVTSWVVALIFTLPSAFLAGFLCTSFSPEMQSLGVTKFLGPGVYWITALIFLVSLFLIFIPNKIFSLLNYILNFLKRPKINFEISIKTALAVYFGYFLCWISYGFSFWLFVSAISSQSNVPIITSIGIFIIAYQIGYLTIFAPGGIGTRELVLSIALTPFVGPIAAGIAIAARLWNMVVEIIAAFIALKIRFKSR